MTSTSIRLLLLLLLLLLALATGSTPPPGAPGPDLAAEPTTNYLLYTVNPGEGFNLARDVAVRAFALVQHLNSQCIHSKDSGDGGDTCADSEPCAAATPACWVLVLPPFSNPHWRRVRNRPWREFFDLDTLRARLPVVELEDFVAARGPQLDRVLHLQSFFPEGGQWLPELRLDKPCEFGSYPGTSYWQEEGSTDEESGAGRLWHGQFWGRDDMTARRLACAEVFGDALVVAPHLQQLAAEHAASTSDPSPGLTVLLARFEALLHVDYGGPDYWALRKSLVFAQPLQRVAAKIARSKLPGPGQYLAVHLRRRDFLKVHRDAVPALSDTLEQLAQLRHQHGLAVIFVATDASEQDTEFWRLFRAHDDLVKLAADDAPGLHEGQLAIVEQLLCVEAALFVGTEHSTFSSRIREERHFRGFATNTSDLLLCPRAQSEDGGGEAIFDCPRATTFF